MNQEYADHEPTAPDAIGDESLRIQGLLSRRNARGRAQYSRQGKAAVVRLCQQPGVSTSKVALVNGLNTNMLRKWVRIAQQGRQRAKTHQSTPSTALLPVRVQRQSTRAPLPPRTMVDGTPPVEVRLARGTLQIHALDRQMLATLIDILAQPR